MITYRSVKGIAWDDEPEYFEKVSVKLNQSNPHITLAITSNLAEFHRWIGSTGYDFALLDIFEANPRGEPSPIGLHLCAALRNKYPDMPLILASDLFDTFDDEVVANWDLGNSTSIWSKYLRENWFAYYLRQFLDDQGLLVKTNSWLVLGDASYSERAELETSLSQYGISVAFEQQFNPLEIWSEIEVRIRSFAGFAVLVSDDSKDISAVDIARIMTLPRARERLTIACRPGQLSWLEHAVTGGHAGLTSAIPPRFKVTDNLLRSIEKSIKKR